MAMNDITHDRIVEIVGDIEDIRVAEILATGASEDEIEEAAHWASGMSQPGKTVEHNLVGLAARVYDILTADRTFEEEERR